jgi:aryl-alcohol dehydrogenase-like predicted oxidoreductase
VIVTWDGEASAIAARGGIVADRIGAPRAAVALAWVLAKPGITSPTIGLSKPHHLDDALKAMDIKLDAELMAFLEEPYRPKPVVAMD